jgi:PleD family two-component response regulator
MEAFEDNDADYRGWIYANVEGYVVDVPRRVNREPTLHRAVCEAIMPTLDKTLTADSSKVCSTDWRKLEAWARSRDDGLKTCEVCDPRTERDAPTILTIDDEAPIRLLIRVNFEAAGMNVIEARDGSSGLQVAEREQPDLILLDVMMPVVDGWRVCEQLRDNPLTQHIPVVFLTARKEFRDEARGLEIGAIEYRTQPFNPIELAARVRTLVARIARGERDEIRRENLRELRARLENEGE